VHTIIDFSDIIHRHVFFFYLGTTFQSLDSAPSSGKKPIQFGPIGTASPYLRSPEPESELLYDWRFTAYQFVLATSLLRLTTSNFFFQLNTCYHSPYVTSSLTRRWVCRLQLLLVFVSEVILRSESRGTHDHILLSQIRQSPYHEGQVSVFISSPQEQGGPVIPPSTGFHRNQYKTGHINQKQHKSSAGTKNKHY
jgi:hypothetical protein